MNIKLQQLLDQQEKNIDSLARVVASYKEFNDAVEKVARGAWKRDYFEAFLKSRGHK